MLINMVTFEVLPEGKETFFQKTQHNIASLKKTDSCLGAEFWYNETAKSIEFTIISRWNDKKDFQNWLKRPSHLQEHREAHKNKQSPSLVIKKTTKSFTTIE